MRVSTVSMSAGEKRSNGNYGSNDRHASVTLELAEGDDHGEAMRTCRRLLRQALGHAWQMAPVEGGDAS